VRHAAKIDSLCCFFTARRLGAVHGAVSFVTSRCSAETHERVKPVMCNDTTNNNKRIVVTSESLGPGSVLLRREKRESPGEEECF